MAQCYACGNSIDRSVSLGRSSACSACGADLRVCLNCRHYDPAAAHQCREAITYSIDDKRQGNFCDFFQLPLPGEAVRGVVPGAKDPRTQQARKGFDSLFGGS